MKICYVDEAGCTGSLPKADSPIQPVLALIGLILDYGKLHEVTERLLQHKQRFYLGASAGPKYLSGILTEVKGSDIRKNAISDNRNTRRPAVGYLDGILKICTEADAKLVGRVWVKEIGSQIDGRAIYTSSVQAICSYFHDYLARTEDIGVVIVDSRLKHLNSQVAHSIFTQKFKSSGDQYDRIVELPMFAHSDNHAGLQLADTICSALICPIAINTYCDGYITSTHFRPAYRSLKERYAKGLSALQHRYQETSGRWRGGIVVADGMGQKSGAILFRSQNSNAQE